MPEQNKLISYAMDISSYLISKLSTIDQIILHGSIARGDFDEHSDIDLFINAKDKSLKNKIQKLIDSYYKTAKYNEWKLKGITTLISPIVGDIDGPEWKNLKRAIANTGIILYGKYKTEAEKVSQYTLISFENISPDKKRIAIHRKLFGFKQNKKYYSGLLEKTNSIRIGKGAILTPIEHTQKILNYLKEKKITPKLFDFWSDEKLV
ncbi:MAG: nucleotidyltransferase domain-containing protein [Nanoarchaeota archaeon]